MHDSDRAWLALAAGVAAYDLIATITSGYPTRPAGTSSLSPPPPRR